MARWKENEMIIWEEKERRGKVCSLGKEREIERGRVGEKKVLLYFSAVVSSPAGGFGVLSPLPKGLPSFPENYLHL